MRLLIALLVFLLSALPAGATESIAPIKIGDIASYTGWASYTEPYRKGWQLAIKEINQEGGVLGHPLEVVSRDDHGRPGDTSLLVQELTDDKDVSVIMGSIAGHVTMALSQECLKHRIACLAPYANADRLLWEDGHPYIFRLMPSLTAIGRILVDRSRIHQESAGLSSPRNTSSVKISCLPFTRKSNACAPISKSFSNNGFL